MAPYVVFSRIVILLALFSALASADLSSHRYDKGEEVIVWVNKVGPFNNPQEYYFYYTLPYCAPEKLEDQFEGLGEAIQGYELTRSNLITNFQQNALPTTLCEVVLTEAQAESFQKAIRERYWYQLFVDDLPVWGLVGEMVENEYYLYTHQQLDISFNLDRVIEVNLTSENAVPVRAGAKIVFSYGVNWVETDTPYHRRFDKYLDNEFFEHQIHWFSVLNSLMLVVFLVGVVAMILLRTLHKDYAKYADDDEEDMGEESGWKQIHGDVFRAPSRLVLFSSLIGTAYQLVYLVLFVLVFAMLGNYYRSRGTIVTAFVVCFALTSFIAGYASGGYYLRRGGKNWIKTLLITAFLIPAMFGAIAFVLNLAAHAYNAQSVIPFGTMVVLVSLWLFVSFPLTVVGSIFGRHWSGTPDNPCRINAVPRQIPEKPWYLRSGTISLLGGILPFASIFIEMYFVFTSFWHYKYYYVYGFLLLVYLILAVVVSCVTIVSTYFLLNSEDYRWQWTSFFSGASTGLYVYLYSLHYYWQRTQMTGFLQTSFYFGYMAMFCIGFGILCGGIAYWSTSVFVKRIYRNVKID